MTWILKDENKQGFCQVKTNQMRTSTQLATILWDRNISTEISDVIGRSSNRINEKDTKQRCFEHVNKQRIHLLHNQYIKISQ